MILAPKLIVFALALIPCCGFAPSGIASRTTAMDLRMSATDNKDREKMLRKELEDRNSAIENEEKYSVADGEFLEKVGTPDVEQAIASASAPAKDRTSLQSRMERMTKPRAYPLFLVEKACELAEATYDDLSKSFGLTMPSSSVGVKERLVILGTGWGSASLLKEIDTDLYDVTIVSPRNYFLFTPMLAGASVGTVEYRSITEPIRQICPKANYLEGTASVIDPKTRKVTCESIVCDGNSCDIADFEVEYDRLIVSVGAQTNTFGIPGVREHCCFLRQVEDARRVRTAIVNCFERANLPNLSDEERQRNLTFAIIGAGPTGIEFAAELRDFIEQDGPKYYPQLLKYVRIKIIEASKSVLAPFDKSLQEEAIRMMDRAPMITDADVRNLLPERFKLTELLLETSVKEVKEQTIELNNGESLPYGLAVWAAGNGPIPLTLQLIDALGEEQKKEQDVARGRVAIDPWMRAVGGDGRILVFGDCSCVTNSQLPATAQVASQQGEYLANLLNKKFEFSPAIEDGILPPPTRDPIRTETSFSDAIAGFATNNYEYAKPFQFLNLGILAYTGGGTALSQVTPAPDAPALKGTGQFGNAVWRSVYLSKQVSWRNRLLVLNDWTKRQLFGRDITRI